MKTNSIQAIRNFHSIGCDSLQEHPARMAYGQMQEEADKHGVNLETLRKARAFAQAYSAQQLDELCSLCRKHKSSTGPSHVARFLSVPAKHRKQFQREAIENDWSQQKIDAQIRIRFGDRRPAAGRKWSVPEDADAACCDLLRLCGSFGRFCKALHEERKDQKPVWKQLSKTLRRRIEQAGKAMESLQKLAEMTLDRHHPGRSRG